MRFKALQPFLLRKSLLSHMQSQSRWMQVLLVISRRERGWQNDCWRGSEFGPCYVPHISLVQRAAITVLAVVPEMWLMAKRKLSKERKKEASTLLCWKLLSWFEKSCKL